MAKKTNTSKPKAVAKKTTPAANGGGLRYNEGKTMHELIEPFALDQLAQVFTRGALKYAPNNWLKGMSWQTIIGCLKRHLNKFEQGHDFDNETELLHIAHVAWNAMALISAHKHFPQHDDRLHTQMPKRKIGLDIDELLCNWAEPWAKKFGHPIPKNWNFSYKTKDNFGRLGKKELEAFYLALPAKISPDKIPFEPHCYITSRSVPTNLTQTWLEKNGFSCAPVYSVGFGQSKVDTCKQAGIDIFCDDSYDNYRELNAAGICTYLYDAPHNQRYNVGYRRVKTLEDLANKLGL